MPTATQALKSHKNNKYDGPDKFREASLRVCQIIRDTLSLKDTSQVSLYAWNHPKAGFRIAEIGTFFPNPAGGGAGGSWMRSDSPAAGILLAAEDIVVYSMYFHKPKKKDDPNDPDFAAEAEERLVYLLEKDNK